MNNGHQLYSHVCVYYVSILYVICGGAIMSVHVLCYVQCLRVADREMTDIHLHCVISLYGTY